MENEREAPHHYEHDELESGRRAHAEEKEGERDSHEKGVGGEGD